ncbi:MAG: M56 family metallopeptidase, partial [Saprospiraceae bacterium]
MLSIWFGGVFILMLRLAFSLAWVQHIRSEAAPLAPIQNTVNDLIERLKIKINPLASESGYIPSPMTIGHIKPMILFPIGIINQLTPQEVEAVLTHELAHIVRRDYLSNLIQSFIETLFYYHPVTWWISNKVRTERENRADDLAVSWCGDHVGYAKTLITVQEMQLAHGPSLAIGFASGKGAMLARIQRILHIPYKNHNQMEKTVLISLCSLFFFGFTLNSHPNTDQKKENQPTTTEQVTVITTSVPDSIPAKGTFKIHKKTDDQDISIEVKDGDIKELQIDGKNIAPSQFDQYGEVIDDLFGAIEAPPSPEGFTFTMPAMPPMPPMPDMPLMPNMPPMPGMPRIPALGMNEMELEQLFKDGMKEGFTMKIFNPEFKGKHGMINEDTTIVKGRNKYIYIFSGKDTIETLPFNWSEAAPEMKFENNILQNNKDWTLRWDENAKQWKGQEKEWKKNWEEYAQQWKEGTNEQQEQMQAEQERMRSQGNRLREEGDHIRSGDDRLREEAEKYKSENYARALQSEL